MWKREPVTMMGAARTLVELFPDRFILGIGISHGPMMAQLGINYSKPVTYMRNYLERMKAAPYTPPRARFDPPIVIAALMPGGEILLSMEMILGYVTLGLLLAVLGDRIARRS